MDWDDRLDAWEMELDLATALAGSEWVGLAEAARRTGVSRAALRTWYRDGGLPSRLVDGPHGPERLVPLSIVTARAEASPRLRRAATRSMQQPTKARTTKEGADACLPRRSGRSAPSDPTAATPVSLRALLAEFRWCFSDSTFPVVTALACGLLARAGRRTVYGMPVGAQLSRA